MKRTGPHHTLIAAVRTFVKKRALLRPNQQVIAAVSGGADSMVMLHVLMELQRLWKLRIIVAHVNFSLRGKESDGDERFVHSAAGRLGLPFYSMRVDAAAEAARSKCSVQEAARDLRYAFFESLRQSLGADLIATAHHADDNTETMLINLLRGSGVDGLAGIPPKRGAVIRPLLCVTRQMIEEFAEERKIRFRNDSSNGTDDYTRNLLRRRIVPTLMRRVNPSLHSTMMQEAETFRTMAEFLRGVTDRSFRECVTGTSVMLEPFRRLHLFLQQSVMHRMLNETGIETTAAAITAVTELAGRQKGTVVELPGGWCAERTADRILLRNSGNAAPFRYELSGPGTVTGESFTLTLSKGKARRNKRTDGSSMEYVDAARITFPVTVRSWQSGDRFQPLGMTGRRKLSDLFSGLKMTEQEKHRVPVVECSGNIVWVAGVRLDERYKLTDSTTAVYTLTVHHHGKKDGRR
ncbi:MAG: tRNA lysidine(34) synthetase TilS [Bacteroidetes bacterium]|nr:tRNA lysidine(34) synthetase TilS [Bacteroidota bacterium]